MNNEITCNVDVVLREIKKLYDRRKEHLRPITEIGVDTLVLTLHTTLSAIEPILEELAKEGKIKINSSLSKNNAATTYVGRSTVSLIL